jgi:hypothetical protein
MMPVCTIMCIPRTNFWMTEPIFMKLGMYIMALEPISTAYFINPSHQCVCMCLLLGNGSVKTLPLQRMHMQQKKNYTYSFLRSPCRIKGKWAISSSQNFSFILFIDYLTTLPVARPYSVGWREK